jgi:hypothetical protein
MTDHGATVTNAINAPTVDGHTIDYGAVAERYLSIWNTTDAESRGAQVKQLFAEDARYTDPLGVANGWEGIDSFVSAAQEQFAGLSFRLAGPVDGHHDLLRLTWRLGSADEPLVIGFDVIVLDGGRVRQVHGFLDKVPASA